VLCTPGTPNVNIDLVATLPGYLSYEWRCLLLVMKQEQ
jgi:hypothetical protein